MIMSSDESYNRLIEYDSGDSVEDEDGGSTSQGKGKRKIIQKTLAEQFEKLIDFMNKNDKNKIGRRKFEDLWDDLVSELNQLGPPQRTSEKWKNIWFNYKSKHLKKAKLSMPMHTSKLSLSTMETSKGDTSHPETEDQIDQQTSLSVAVVGKDKPSSKSKKRALSLVETVELPPSALENPKEDQTPSLLSKSENANSDSVFQLKAMDKLDMVIKEMKTMNEHMEAMVTENKSTNVLEKTLNENIAAMLAENKETNELLGKILSKK